MEANCYLVEGDEEVLIIDPGDDADFIGRRIADLEKTPVALIATHGHFDHVMASLELKLAYKIPFIACSEDKFLLDRLESTSAHFSETKSLPAPPIDMELKSGEVTVGEFAFTVIDTPGHTPGSKSLYFKDEGIIFVGDLVFANGFVGRTDFKYAKPLQLHESIDKVLELPNDTVVYSGHGEETTVGSIISEMDKERL